ncbi:hypothetical protein ACB098_11G086800 [Castanea mollissima]
MLYPRIQKILFPDLLLHIPTLKYKIQILFPDSFLRAERKSSSQKDKTQKFHHNTEKKKKKTRKLQKSAGFRKQHNQNNPNINRSNHKWLNHKREATSQPAG